MKFGIFYEHQLPRAAGADWDDDPPPMCTA